MSKKYLVLKEFVQKDTQERYLKGQTFEPDYVPQNLIDDGSLRPFQAADAAAQADAVEAEKETADEAGDDADKAAEADKNKGHNKHKGHK